MKDGDLGLLLLVLTAGLDSWHILKRLADMRRSSLFQHFTGYPLSLHR
jgi:hypothetical protein